MRGIIIFVLIMKVIDIITFIQNCHVLIIENSSVRISLKYGSAQGLLNSGLASKKENKKLYYK